MLLKRGQLENKKGFLDVQNTKSEIKFTYYHRNTSGKNPRTESKIIRCKTKH